MTHRCRTRVCVCVTKNGQTYVTNTLPVYYILNSYALGDNYLRSATQKKYDEISTLYKHLYVL